MKRIRFVSLFSLALIVIGTSLVFVREAQPGSPDLAAGLPLAVPSFSILNLS